MMRRMGLTGAALTTLMILATGCPPTGTAIHVDDDSACATGCGDAANPWPTIAQGLAAATAGATVHVNAGTYAESELAIPVDGLTLEGDGPEATFINNGGADVTAIRVWGRDGVTIRNLAIEQNRQGINVWRNGATPTTNLTVTGCAFFVNDPYGSIQLSDVAGATITDNHFVGDNLSNPVAGSVGAGVNATGLTIGGNIFEVGQIGVEVTDGAQATVTGNGFYSMFGDAIRVGSGANGRGTATIENNTIEEAGGHGIRSWGGANLSITGNSIVSGGINGITLIDTQTAAITNNTMIWGNAFWGISCEADPSTAITCSNNNIAFNGDGSINGCGAACVN
ncbi:MAG: right-handed parallel beta-helix repeat-containing protein [Myxococcales bacterium]|nr:right-handed parallel beta-helix repeat-containing protein [Myxococcales bacterium]